MIKFTLIAVLSMWMPSANFQNSEIAPWGSAKKTNISYQPQKVLYDLLSGDTDDVDNILNRVSFLNKIYAADPFDSSIVVMIHGDAVSLFAKKNYYLYKNLMDRAQSLSVGTTIEFRLCEAAASMRGLTPKDFHGYLSVVPMADAEIIRLQKQENYAYMR